MQNRGAHTKCLCPHKYHRDDKGTDCLYPEMVSVVIARIMFEPGWLREFSQAHEIDLMEKSHQEVAQWFEEEVAPELCHGFIFGIPWFYSRVNGSF